MQPDPLDIETPWRSAIATGLRDILRAEPPQPPADRSLSILPPVPGFAAIATGLDHLTAGERERLAVVLIGMIRADRDRVAALDTIDAEFT